MISLIELRPEDVGRQVRYKPTGERGPITSWNSEFVFVRYGANPTGTATDPGDLEWWSRYPGELEEKAEPSLTCPRCGMTSYNLNDIAQVYCGKCDLFLRDEAQRILVEFLPTDDAKHAARMEYIYLRTLSDGRHLAIEPALWDQAYLKLCADDGPFGVDDAWMYQARACAVIAAATWDPATDKEPFGWWRHPSSARRRTHGNPKNEYVRE